ncbi:ubiquitin carboxyl-hydrolase [Actinomyces oris]|uniref:Ubiquitin carboxyl-hydrolase n=1 Tax=Actinomyces oris TaxID=544580 RepID=A0AAW9KLL1_9ACTO|nr:ubiquitin carboxyl-hydrolase [Actinomyces oris]MEA1304057.1 ubiquitin carboxyl-hydrolase [Actinomyces oris]
MASLLHRFGRGRVIAAAVVVVTAGLLLAVTRMVFSHPAESAKEPGIVLTASPRATSSHSSTTATPSRSVGGAGSTQHEPGGTEAGSSASSDSLTQGHGPQAVEPNPPVAVDHGHRQPAPAAPAAPTATKRSDDSSRTEVDDDDDDKKPVRNGVKDADDDDRDIDD